MKVYERVCTGRFARWMRRRHWGGCCIPLSSWHCLILYWLKPHDGIITHERHHALQVQRHGFLKIVAMYLYYTVRFGYERNPLEREARIAAGQE